MYSVFAIFPLSLILGFLKLSNGQILFSTSPNSLTNFFQDAEIETVGLHLVGYSSSRSHSTSFHVRNFSLCEYCTKCPDFEEYDSGTNFLPCPEQFRVLTNQLAIEIAKMEPTKDRYISEFIGFHHSAVHVYRRIFTTATGKGQLYADEDFPEELNVTKTELELKSVDIDTIIPPKTPEAGEEKSWQEVALEDAIKGPHVIVGTLVIENWEGTATESRVIWPLKKSFTRDIAASYLLEMAEPRTAGCECIQQKLKSGVEQEKATKECRASLNVREELRPILKLNKCFTPAEVEELIGESKQKKRVDGHPEL